MSNKGERPDKEQMQGDFLPFDMGYLPPFFKKKAEIELNESPENIEKGVRKLREMAKKDNIIRNIAIDDGFLVHFLRCRKYDIGSAFSRLKAFAVMKKNFPEMFTGLRFYKLCIAMRLNYVSILPWRCHDGCAVMYANLENWDPEQFTIDDIKQSVTVLLAQSLMDPMNQVNGFKVIINAKSNSVKHLKFITPSNMSLLYYGPQKSSAASFKAIHFINSSLAFNLCWMIVKHFLSNKMKQRLFFHDDPKTLQNYFSAAILPKEIGGTLNYEQYDMTEWLRKSFQERKANICLDI